MNPTNHYNKYLKYKSKYINLVYNIENLQNQEGGAQRYPNQYMITFKLNIMDQIFKSNINKRYQKIRESINEVKSQQPHFTLFQIIINADNQNVKNHVNYFLSRDKNQGKNPSDAIHWLFGNLIRDIDIDLFNVKYNQGIDTYKLFVNDSKYFYSKEFIIDNQPTKDFISKIISDIINILIEKFKLNGNLTMREIEIYGKPSKIYLQGSQGSHGSHSSRGLGSSEVFYYNKFYENPTTLHITIAKILKNEWVTKYQVFNITNEEHGRYFLNVCNKIISNAVFDKLFNNTRISRDILEAKIETRQYTT